MRKTSSTEVGIKTGLLQ